MAQSGYTPILIYGSGTASNVPTSGNLITSANGAELALNYTDGKLFYKDNGGVVQVIAWKTTPVTAGGTGLTSLIAGYIPFGNGTAALNNSANLTYTTGTSTFSAPIISAATSMANAGNMLFSGSAARIQGDFSNATLVNRTAFQDKTANGVTGIAILPNGTASESAVTCFNNSDPTNSSYGGINCNATGVRLGSAATGSGSALPLLFVVGAGGPEAARIDTSQNFMVGTTATTGSISNAKYVSAGIFSTANGSTSAANGTATTLFTLPDTAWSMWLISIQLDAFDAPNYSAFAILAAQHTQLKFQLNVAGALLTISNSGLAIRGTQSSGVSATIQWSVTRIQ